jgi:hypothetical protein
MFNHQLTRSSEFRLSGSDLLISEFNFGLFDPGNPGSPAVVSKFRLASYA